MSTRSIVEKADIAVSNLVSSGDGWNGGGLLNPMQANTFLRMVHDVPTMLKQMRHVFMPSPQMNLDKIGFANRIMRPAVSSTPLASDQRAAPDLGQITLTTDEFICEVNIPYDVLEDNIEGRGLEDTIMQLMTQRIALDLEELVLLSDETSADPYLAKFDGVIKRASDDSNTVDVTGWVDDNSADQTHLTPRVFRQALLSMPPKYLRNRDAFKYFVNHENETIWRDWIARNRMTQLGDNRLEGYDAIRAQGIRIETAALMPTANVLMVVPQNLIWGIHRRILIETDKDIRRRVLIIVVSMRVGFQIEETEAIVLVENIDNTTLPAGVA